MIKITPHTTERDLLRLIKRTFVLQAVSCAGGAIGFGVAVSTWPHTSTLSVITFLANLALAFASGQLFVSAAGLRRSLRFLIWQKRQAGLP